MSEVVQQGDQDPEPAQQAPPAQQTQAEANQAAELLRAAEARRVLIEEIRAEVKTQNALKKDIIKELQPTSFWTQVAELAKHPVILLLIGSLFGGWLSSWYQQREWNRQQNLLSQKQKIEKKINTRDDVSNSIIEAYSTAESGVRPVFYENAATFTAALKDREKEWFDASKKWQTAKWKVREKIDLYFTDPNITNKFVEITDLNHKLFVEVNNVLGAVKSQPAILNESTKPFEKQSPEYIALKDRIRANVLAVLSQAATKTKELRDLMQQEIEKESKQQQ